MFRLLRILFLLVIGILIGTQFSAYAMHQECALMEGEWTSGVCVISEARHE